METRQKRLLTLAFTFTLSGALPACAQENAPAETAPSVWRKFGETRPSSEMPLPAELTAPAGTWLTIRVDQPLSSDHNQPGDAFTGTLAQPLVAKGVVIARRGQTVGGRVAEAQKAGRIKGTSRLGVEVTEISLVDGEQVPVRTQLIERGGDTSIGAVADGGFGAGMGAIAGAAASTIGVLVTRGNATVVYPETVLTFRLEQPLTVSTARAPQAFRPVTQGDYERRDFLRQGPPPAPAYAPYYIGYYPPYFYGPGVFFYSGPAFYHGRGFYRRW